jgi:hypothetical protein
MDIALGKSGRRSISATGQPHKKVRMSLPWRRGKDDFSHQEVAYADKEVQVDDSGEYFAAADLPHSEQDRIIPWDSPSLMPPMCSWSSFPPEPSPALKQLVEFFTLPASGSPRPA